MATLLEQTPINTTEQVKIATGTTYEKILEEVEFNHFSIMNIPIEFKNNQNIIIAALLHDGLELQYASIKIRNMQNICFLAVQQNGTSLEFVEQKTHKICMAAIMQNIDALQFVPSMFIDEQMIEIILKIDGLAIKYMSDELKQIKWVALLAVTQNGQALELLQSHNNNFDIVNAAVSNFGLAILFASDDLKQNRNIAIAAIKNDGRAFAYLPKPLLDDLEILHLAIKSSGNLIKWSIKSSMYNNIEIAIALAMNGSLSYDSPKLEQHILNDSRFIQAIVDYSANNIINVPTYILVKSHILSALKQNGLLVAKIPPKLIDKECAIVAVKQNGFAIKYLPQFQTDKQILIFTVTNNGLAIQYIKLFREPIIISAINSNPLAFLFVPKKYRTRNIISCALNLKKELIAEVPEYYDEFKYYGKLLDMTKIARQHKALFKELKK